MELFKKENKTACCKYCGKDYTRKTSLQRHEILCETIYKSKREKTCDQEETTDIPSRQQLYQIIQELAIKYDKLQEKMNDMQKWVQTKKKKVNIIEWLNNNHPQSISFQSWMKSIHVSDTHVKLLIEENIVQTMNTILRDNLQPEKGKPFASFSQKANQLYTFDDNPKEWRNLNQDDFVIIIKQIHSRLLRELCEWRNKNAKEIAENEKMSDLYNKTVIKLMGLNFNPDSSALSKIRSTLYNSLKIDLKQTLELEFE
jgi:hypothetical protein